MVGFGSLFFVWKDRDKVIVPEKGKLRVHRERARIWSASVEAVRGTPRRPEQGKVETHHHGLWSLPGVLG